jgi:feruloyl esterase
MGGSAETDKFARLFMIPGAGHCWEPPHTLPDIFNPIEVLEKWVENGVAPEQIIARKVDDSGKVIRTRPLCPYPKAAIYDGTGSIDDALSFSCKVTTRID